MRAVIIGTRGSSLAMCQAQIVQTKLEESAPRQPFTLQPLTTRADRHPEAPLTALGEEGVFVKELEAALLDGRIDLAIHSMKDMPLDIPSGLRITAVLERDEPRDALVSCSGAGLEQLPSGARVGTSSPRRRSQLLRLRDDLRVLEMRGNLDTRLRKLDEGRYDAIVVAACGLIRLGLEHRIAEYLEFAQMLPEPGQGALAIETRSDDRLLGDLVARLEDPMTRACIDAERAFLRALGGGCRVPVAAYAACREGMLTLEGTITAVDGHGQVRGTDTAPMTEPVTLGERLARRLTAQGARELLDFKNS